MNKKVIITIVIVFVVIIIAVVAFLIYRNVKKKNALQSQQEIDILRQQLNANPNMPASQKTDIIAQIAALIAKSAGANQTTDQTGGQFPGGGFPSGYPSWPPPTQGGPAGFPLVKGAKGNYVKSLQMAINAKCGDKLRNLGMLPLTTDGKFGPLTEKGVAACIGTTNVSWPQFQGLTV
jgi:hypothetical protein